MTHLTPLETKVLSALLDGPGTGLATLRRQMSNCRVEDRSFTGVGFFTRLLVPSRIPSAVLASKSVRFGDVLADAPGRSPCMGFLLYIESGRLSTLEGYTFDGPMPDPLELVSLSYMDDTRDLSWAE
jgi:hypothetical protein